MKKLLYILGLGAALGFVAAGCNDDNKSTWEVYSEWRENNKTWLQKMQAMTNPDGTPYYSVVIPQWNPGSYILMHFVNDRAETEGNLTPLYTSTVDTRYTLHLYEGTGIDSSTFQSDYGPGIFRTQLSGVIQGWAVALTNMRCGDTADVIIPYDLGYGVSVSGTIPPFSNLQFGIRLVDIPNYETTPY